MKKSYSPVLMAFLLSASAFAEDPLLCVAGNTSENPIYTLYGKVTRIDETLRSPIEGDFNDSCIISYEYDKITDGGGNEVPVSKDKNVKSVIKSIPLILKTSMNSDSFSRIQQINAQGREIPLMEICYTDSEQNNVRLVSYSVNGAGATIKK